jgi:hypothetical protein
MIEAVHTMRETMVMVEFRRTIWSERADVRPFLPGASINDIVRAFNLPMEFERFGGVYLKRDRADPGHVVPRELWHRVRPKPGTMLFVSLIPQGGGEGGGSGKTVFAAVAAVALIALSYGTASFLTPLIGAFGAKVVAAAVVVGGSLALQSLTKPTAGREAAQVSGAGSSGPTLGVAGISQNPISAWQQIPCVQGFFRISPPLLAKPFTIIEQNDQIVNMICGAAGQYDISEIMINETAITDFPAGTIEYQTREGWEDDEELTLITQSVFEENIGQEMSKHRLDIDQATLIAPHTASYPKPFIMKTARRTDDFRILLSFPSGFGQFDSNADRLMAFRVRIRPIVNGTPGAWVNLPEMHMQASTRSPLRQEIWLIWGEAAEEDSVRAEVSGEQSFWPLFYYANSEWAASSYFFLAGAGATNTNVRHVYAGRDEVYFFLDTETFAQGQYEVEITRSRMSTPSGFTSSSYGGGLFTYTAFNDPNYSIPSQKDFSQSVVIQSYASFRNEYPIRRPGLALIAVQARNIQIQSVSALFKQYVDGVLTQNPKVIFEDVATGALNAQPLDPARLADLTEWEDHCDDNNLTCNRVIESGSVEDALVVAAQCGDALLRRSDKWGVVVDKDRSEEDSVGVITPQVMVKPLVVTIEFLTGARGIVPSFHDETNNYSIREFDEPVFDDGVAVTTSTLIESTPYDGLTTDVLVRRRALRDLRAARLRNKKYSFALDIRGIDLIKGDKIGLAHDVLRHSYGSGRVRSFVVASGNLVSVTLNTACADIPAAMEDNILFEAPDVFFDLKNVFDVSEGVSFGMQIELPDATIATIPLQSADGKTLSVDGTVALPSGLAQGCMVAVGPTDRETRPVIIANITPIGDFQANFEAVDLAPEIYQGLAA